VAFTEDLSQFFEEDDFAVAVAIKIAAGASVRTISGIFNTPSQEVEIFDTNFEGNLPSVLCRSSDLAGITNAHTMTISAVVYRITKIEPDGTGVSTVHLRKS
jgi:hypothetical protein